jgi:hypothetical protein
MRGDRQRRVAPDVALWPRQHLRFTTAVPHWDHGLCLRIKPREYSFGYRRQKYLGAVVVVEGNFP